MGFNLAPSQDRTANIATSDIANPSQATSNPPALLTAPIWTPEHADANYLAAAQAHIKQIIALDNRFGGADLAKLAERSFRAIHNLLGTGSYMPSIEKDLMATAGELAEVVGWLSYDADRQDAVRRMNQESLYFTRLAGDKKTELLTLQNASMHAGFLNRPERHCTSPILCSTAAITCLLDYVRCSSLGKYAL